MAIERERDYFKYMVEDSISELGSRLFDHKKQAKRLSIGITIGDLMKAIWTDENTEKPTEKTPFLIVGEEWMGGYSWNGIIQELQETISDLDSYGSDRRMYLRLTMNLIDQTVAIKYVDGLKYDLELILIGEEKSSVPNAMTHFFALGYNYEVYDAEGANDRKVLRFKGLTQEEIIVDGIPF